MKKTLLTLTLAGQALLIWSQTTVNLELTKAQPALLTASAGNDVSITDVESTVLTAATTGGTAPFTYKWAPATNLSSTTSANPTATPKSTISYSLAVTDNNKCTASDTVKVSVSKYINSTNNAATEGLTIYPNPVGANFYINLQTQAATTSVSLYTLDGKLLWQKTIASAELSETALEAPATPGMYLLNVTSGSLIITETIVVTQNNK